MFSLFSEKGQIKRLIAVILLIALAAVVTVGATYALLTSFAGPVENDFTIGKVEISLTETTGTDYQLIPGKVIEKDTTVTVKGGSEDCWLYVVVSENATFHEYLSYSMDDGWLPLHGYAGVYYRSVVKSASDTPYRVIKDNAVKVSDTLTEEKMSEIQSTPTLTFKAYAVQSHSVETVIDGWLLLNEEVGG